MHSMSDEMLMAYADDALSENERRQVEAAIAAKPAMRHRLEPFLVTRSTLPELFSEALTSPMPDRLIRTVMTAPIAKPRTLGADAVAGTILARVRAFLLPEIPSFGSRVALAAIVVALAGGSWLAQRTLTPVAGPGANAEAVAVNDNAAYADGVLAKALESAPIGQAVRSGSAVAAVANTFFDHNGHVCRQYDVADAANGAAVGFACRGGDGRWQIGFHVPVKDTAKPTQIDKNAPAEGPDVKSLEDAIDGVIKGDVVSAAEDEALLANGWLKAKGTEGRK